jgi:hypothetical protein
MLITPIYPDSVFVSTFAEWRIVNSKHKELMIYHTYKDNLFTLKYVL